MAEEALEGGCACGTVRYRMLGPPLIVHCCHCTWCQRETGSAFALTAYIETALVVLTKAAPEQVTTPSASGKGQIIARCPTCRVAVWSHYAGAGPRIAFVRVGTLDAPGGLTPDIHIFTSTKLPWVVIPEGARTVPEYYRRSEVWSDASLARWRALGEPGVPAETARSP